MEIKFRGSAICVYGALRGEQIGVTGLSWRLTDLITLIGNHGYFSSRSLLLRNSSTCHY